MPVAVNPRLLMRFKTLCDRYLLDDRPQLYRPLELLRHTRSLAFASGKNLEVDRRLPRWAEPRYVLLNAVELHDRARFLDCEDWAITLLGFVEGWQPREDHVRDVLHVVCDIVETWAATPTPEPTC